MAPSPFPAFTCWLLATGRRGMSTLKPPSSLVKFIQSAVKPRRQHTVAIMINNTGFRMAYCLVFIRQYRHSTEEKELEQGSYGHRNSKNLCCYQAGFFCSIYFRCSK